MSGVWGWLRHCVWTLESLDGVVNDNQSLSRGVGYHPKARDAGANEHVYIYTPRLATVCAAHQTSCRSHIPQLWPSGYQRGCSMVSPKPAFGNIIRNMSRETCHQIMVCRTTVSSHTSNKRAPMAEMSWWQCHVQPTQQPHHRFS